jgi:hypothetical protein
VAFDLSPIGQGQTGGRFALDQHGTLKSGPRSADEHLGLIELIVLSIGYDLGVLSPTVFTMLVLMALVTTFMTGPVLTWIERIRWKREAMSVKSLPERL